MNDGVTNTKQCCVGNHTSIAVPEDTSAAIARRSDKDHTVTREAEYLECLGAVIRTARSCLAVISQCPVQVSGKLG